MPFAQDAVRRILAPLTRTRTFRAVGPIVMPPLEKFTAAVSGGRVQLSGLLVPSLVLHTKGARSGEPRESVLMYCPDGHGSAIIAGTSFARERHPGWTYNLLADPRACISVRGTRFAVTAHPIEGAAREKAWATIERQWPGYRAYERSSGRTVRLFLLQLTAREDGQ